VPGVTGAWTVAEIVRLNARARGGHVAVRCGGASLTWHGLHCWSNQVAHALTAAGIGPGDRVAVLDRNGIDQLAILFGVLKIGAVHTPLNWRSATPEVLDLLDDSEARVLFLGGEFDGHRPPLAARPGAPAVLAIGDPGGGALRRFSAAHPESDPGLVSGPGDVVLQLYTSGTTGRPKGVMLTNANLGALIDGTREIWTIDASCVNSVTSPLFHIGGVGWALAGMVGGGSTVVFRDLHPDALVAGFRQHGITHGFVVPALIQAMLAVPGVDREDFAALRSLYYGASPISESLLVRALEVIGPHLVQLYGMTESTGAFTQLDTEDHDPGGPRRHLLRSAGRAFPWVELRVVEPATGVDSPVGTTGEVWTRSAQNMLGYWKNPEATAATLTPDGWLRTGDGGSLDAEGYLFVTDRIKDMIVSGAENVYPAEVENALAAHPAVAEVAVIGVPDHRWGETVKAVVVLATGAGAGGDAAADELMAFARERLAHYKCPTSVDFVDALPRNPTGKVLKRELRAPYWAGQDRSVH
jgi:long-chain acyl-CoA synthetase